VQAHLGVKMDKLSLLPNIEKLAVKAGEAIAPFYQRNVAVQCKEDDSPVTEADLAAHHVIVDGLEELTPDIPIISEESESYDSVERSAFFWLVDPLDGTKSFICGENEFTVNIALIENSRTVMGVIYLPIQKILYSGLIGQGAWKEMDGERTAIKVRDIDETGIDVVKSRSHATPQVDGFLADKQVKGLVKASSSLKFCLVAEGQADLYPRFGRTMEWDTGAGQAIVEAAGGSMTTLEGDAFAYGKSGFENPGFIVKGASK
jgi:3'(2'), 5'-bisphosphate nucleotidase